MIRLANKNDYIEIAKMRWLHSAEDDNVYGEKSTLNVNQKEYINDVVDFLNRHEDFKVFVDDENGVITSCMFVYLIPKVPSPNGNSKYIAYLTKVFTKEEYRNKGIGTELLKYIKNYLKDIKCELIFAWPSDNSINWYKKNDFKEDNDIMECILMDE